MATITYRHPDGSSTVLDAPVGSNIMRVALSNGVHGIEGECGGDAICATCHVYLDDTCKAGFFPPADEMEEEMLECTASPRRDSSRLSCQLRITERHGALAVELPETQI